MTAHLSDGYGKCRQHEMVQPVLSDAPHLTGPGCRRETLDQSGQSVR